MDRVKFEVELQAEGYHETAVRDMAANAANPEHAHPFDARLLILDGGMTIACADEERTYRAGDTFAMAAGRRHAELAGPAGVRYLAGLRHPPVSQRSALPAAGAECDNRAGGTPAPGRREDGE